VIDPTLGNWARDEDLNANGGVILWTDDSSHEEGGVPEEITSRFPRAVLRESVDVAYLMLQPDVPKIRLRIAVVPPPGRLRMAAVEASAQF
jgi:hypothetical protein